MHLRIISRPRTINKSELLFVLVFTIFARCPGRRHHLKKIASHGSKSILKTLFWFIVALAFVFGPFWVGFAILLGRCWDLFLISPLLFPLLLSLLCFSSVSPSSYSLSSRPFSSPLIIRVGPLINTLLILTDMFIILVLLIILILAVYILTILLNLLCSCIIPFILTLFCSCSVPSPRSSCNS